MIRKIFASIRKLSIYILFGLGGIFIGLVILPIEKLLIHPAWKFQQVGRNTVTYAYKLILLYARLIGIVYIEGPKPDMSGLEGKIIAPNHPSLLDVVVMFSMFKGANCIVRGGLLRSVVGPIIKALYIPNNEDLDELKENCKASLDRGETLIIFPEGTRTRKNIPITLKRGCAFISVYADAPIAPFLIRTNDMEGLRKKDHSWTINDDRKYIYQIERYDKEITPKDFEEESDREKSKSMTEELQKILRDNIRNQ